MSEQTTPPTTPKRPPHWKLTPEEAERIAAEFAHLTVMAREDVADESLAAQLRAWIAVHWTKHGHGPTWMDVARQLRPELFEDLSPHVLTGIRIMYLTPLMRKLRARGYVEWTNGGKKGSLRPGAGPKPAQAYRTKGKGARKSGKPTQGAKPAVPAFSSAGQPGKPKRS